MKNDVVFHVNSLFSFIQASFDVVILESAAACACTAYLWKLRYD